MNTRTTTLCLLGALLCLLPACVTTQTGSSAAPPVVEYKRQPAEDIVDVHSRAVISAAILQMMGRDTSKAPVTWAKDGDFKAAFDKFSYDGFAVTGVDVFDQQQVDGRITVQALVRMQHSKGVRAANVVSAMYSDGKGGKPMIHKTLAGPIASRDPVLEVLVVPSDAVRAEPAFKEPSFPGWLTAARRLAVPAPSSGKTKVHVFAFAMERVLATPDLKVDSGSKKSGDAACIDDNGFAACVVSGEMSGQRNRALFYLNGQKAAEALIK